jgi:hypothetical protein
VAQAPPGARPVQGPRPRAVPPAESPAAAHRYRFSPASVSACGSLSLRLWSPGTLELALPPAPACPARAADADVNRPVSGVASADRDRAGWCDFRAQAFGCGRVLADVRRFRRPPFAEATDGDHAGDTLHPDRATQSARVEGGVASPASAAYLSRTPTAPCRAGLPRRRRHSWRHIDWILPTMRSLPRYASSSSAVARELTFSLALVLLRALWLAFRGAVGRRWPRAVAQGPASVSPTFDDGHRGHARATRAVSGLSPAGGPERAH